MSLPPGTSAPAAPYGSVPVPPHPMLGATRTAPYAQAGPQITAAHHIGSSAQIDLTMHDTEGDLRMIVDSGTAAQPAAMPGSTLAAMSGGSSIAAPQNMDAFFNRDSTVVVREIMLNDGTLMRELKRMSPSVSHAQIESEVQAFKAACQQAEERAGSVEQGCHDAVVKTREQARLMLAHQNVEFQRVSQNYQVLAREAAATAVQEAEIRAHRNYDSHSAGLRTQLQGAIDEVQRTRSAAVNAERNIEETARSETTNYREETRNARNDNLRLNEQCAAFQREIMSLKSSGRLVEEQLKNQTQAYQEERHNLRQVDLRHIERERSLLERIGQLEAAQPAEMPGSDQFHAQIQSLQKELRSLTEKDEHNTRVSFERAVRSSEEVQTVRKELHDLEANYKTLNEQHDFIKSQLQAAQDAWYEGDE